MAGVPLFVEARNFTKVQAPRRISLVVLHSTENPEKPGKALDVARWFAGDQAPQASAHYVVDSGQVVQCVREQDVAWAAPGANSRGIQIEMVGYARQEAEDWADTYSLAMIDRVAGLTAIICSRYNIPAWFVNAEGLVKGDFGITTHAEVTKAFHQSTHTDPGPNFPMTKFIAQVAETLGRR